MQHINNKRTVKSYFYRNKGWFMTLILSDLLEALGLVVVSYFISRVFEVIGTTDMNKVFGLLPMGAFALIFFFGSLLCNHPATKPYVANSNAMQNAVGNIGGIPSVNERKIGAISPTVSPQGAPQKNPHKSTGMCIGHSIDPICGT